MSQESVWKPRLPDCMAGSICVPKWSSNPRKSCSWDVGKVSCLQTDLQQYVWCRPEVRWDCDGLATCKSMQKVTTNKTDRNYDYKTICIHSTDVAIQLRCLVFKNFERIWLMCVLFRRVSKMQSQIVDPSMIGIWQQQMLSTVLDTIDSLSKFITNAKRPAKM